MRQKTTYSISVYGINGLTREEVKGYRVSEHFATRKLRYREWSLDHIPSGGLIPARLTTLSAVEKVALKLEYLPVRWGFKTWIGFKRAVNKEMRKKIVSITGGVLRRVA